MRWPESSPAVHTAQSDKRASATVRSNWLYRSASSCDASERRAFVVYCSSPEKLRAGRCCLIVQSKKHQNSPEVFVFRKFPEFRYAALRTSSVSPPGYGADGRTKRAHFETDLHVKWPTVLYSERFLVTWQRVTEGQGMLTLNESGHSMLKWHIGIKF
jgi:hypothetical protein